MQSSKLDNALMVNWTELNHVDIKKYVMLAIIGIGIMAIFLLMR